MFKEHFLFALYLFIIFIFKWKFSVKGGCPWVLLGSPGAVHTHTHTHPGVPPVCPVSGVGGKRNQGLPLLEWRGAVFDPHLITRNGARGGGVEWEGGLAGECQVDFAPMV